MAFGVSLIAGTNSLTMAIAADNGGTPGAILETFTFVNQMGAFGSQNAPLTATSVLNPLLTAGTNYWILGLPAHPMPWPGGILMIRRNGDGLVQPGWRRNLDE